MKIIKKLGNTILKVINFYISAANYLGKVSLAVLGLGLAIIPTAYLTYYLLLILGINTSLPEGKSIPIDPRDTLMLFSLTLMIGIVEETIYRYLVMDCLLDKVFKFSSKYALIASALLFGFAHLYNTPYNMWLSVPQAIGAIAGGLVLGTLYRKYGLHFSIMTHAIYDFILMKWFM